MADIKDFIQNLNVQGGAYYEIKVKGRITATWSDWFNDMKIVQQNGNTVLRGFIKDQSALQGILLRILDFNLKLLSVKCIDPEEKEVPDKNA